jgi:hypothetical protein
VESRLGADIWEVGIGHLMIARQEPEGAVIFGTFLVDVHCLGVKDAYWRAGTRRDLEDLIELLNEADQMRAISPPCLAKIVTGAVAYTDSLGLSLHPAYRHASMLLDGIDISTCANEYTFGRDGKPYYVRGRNDSRAQAAAIMERIQNLGESSSIASRSTASSVADPLTRCEIDPAGQADSVFRAGSIH